MYSLFYILPKTLIVNAVGRTNPFLVDASCLYDIIIT